MGGGVIEGELKGLCGVAWKLVVIGEGGGYVRGVVRVEEDGLVGRGGGRGVEGD